MALEEEGPPTRKCPSHNGVMTGGTSCHTRQQHVCWRDTVTKMHCDQNESPGRPSRNPTSAGKKGTSMCVHVRVDISGKMDQRPFRYHINGVERRGQPWSAQGSCSNFSVWFQCFCHEYKWCEERLFLKMVWGAKWRVFVWLEGRQ